MEKIIRCKNEFIYIKPSRNPTGNIFFLCDFLILSAKQELYDAVVFLLRVDKIYAAYMRKVRMGNFY